MRFEVTVRITVESRASAKLVGDMVAQSLDCGEFLQERRGSPAISAHQIGSTKLIGVEQIK